MRRVYALVAILLTAVALVAVVAVNVGYTRHVQEQADQRQVRAAREADHRWCALLNSLDQPGTPATTERGRLVQGLMHALRVELGCVQASSTP